MKDSDLYRRKGFADFILINMTEVDLMNTAFSDEASFTIGGMVNPQNIRRYCSRKTRGWMRVADQRASGIRPASTKPS